MKALVLAGGSGQRMRPLTHTLAKQLVPVANKPVLSFGLEAIAAAGITDVGLVVGDTAAEIGSFVGDGSRFGVRTTYIRQEQPLGLAHAVRIARDWLGDDDFVLYLGDNYIAGGISAFVDGFRRDKLDAQFLVARVQDPRSFGVAELDRDGRVVGLVEKPTCPKSDLALVGVYLFGPAIHEAVRRIQPSGRGELEITDAMRWLIDAGYDTRSAQLDGYWKDTGTVADILELNRLVLESLDPAIAGKVDDSSEIIGRVEVADGAEVRGSRIVGPAIVGRDTYISDSYIGPFTSIADDCRIAGSAIEYSIMLAGSSLEGVGRIEASLIGRHAAVAPAPRLTGAHRLILGDHTRVRVGP